MVRFASVACVLVIRGTEACTVVQDTDYAGGDYAGGPAESAEDCCAMCTADVKCVAGVFRSGRCYLKNTIVQKNTCPECTVMLPDHSPPQPPPPPQPVPLPPPSPKPSPSPSPKPSDNCDNPLCSSCCFGDCKGCKGFCETNKTGDCAGCWNPSPGAPPCNLRGTQCLSDDALSCEACWSDKPLPALWRSPPAVNRTPDAPPATLSPASIEQDACRTDLPECYSCCGGSCTGCRGYCETHKEGACSNCWTGADGAPPCNLRGTQCLAEDGLSCEMCWQPAPPSPPPAPSPDNCDNPLCRSCCQDLPNSCFTCKGKCETKKDGECWLCWNAAPGVHGPPCNGRDQSCLNDDGLSCEACWSPRPLPASWTPPRAVNHTPAINSLASIAPAILEQSTCRTDLAVCENCCYGGCKGCQGWCETHKDGDCQVCWEDQPGLTQPCNLRGWRCLADDGLACEMCWQPAPPSPPPPPPAPSPDNCDNPLCASCCQDIPNSCFTCKGKCETKKDEECFLCWNPVPSVGHNAPPCNLRDGTCLNDDGLSCEACWSPRPLPTSWTPPRAVKRTPAITPPPSNASAISEQNACRTDVPECEACCTGVCTGCRGWCETHKDGDCHHCWSSSAITPPCNLRGMQCLADDGLSCELCWPSPSPPPSPSPSPHPSTCSATQIPNQDCGDEDVDNLAADSLDDCCFACSSRSTCKVFVYVEGGYYPRCWLKSGCSNPKSVCYDGTCTTGLMSGPAPSPSPTPTPTPSPSPSPSPTEPCPGGDFSGCIGLCPSNPIQDFSDCLHECQRRCDQTGPFPTCIGLCSWSSVAEFRLCLDECKDIATVTV